MISRIKAKVSIEDISFALSSGRFSIALVQKSGKRTLGRLVKPVTRSFGFNWILIWKTKFKFSLELQKSSNKLRMKALVGWNSFYQVSELINIIVFITRIKNDMDKEDKIAWD